MARKSGEGKKVEPNRAQDNPEPGQSRERQPIADPNIGTILDGKYELLSAVGGGGTGVVYKARHCLLDNTVAVKVLIPHLVSRQYAVRRFQQEAMATAALSHPNILQIIDFGTGSTGQPYLVMEFLQGKSLGDYIESLDENASPLLVTEILMQAAHGLMHAHAKGVVHRDIKPSNLMLIGEIPGSFTVKIVDFGLARPSRRDERLAKITVTGEVFGSPSYMSPEQCRGEEVDQRADIYSLGCVFFEALSGKPPYAGKDPIDIIFQHISPEPPKFTIKGTDHKLNNSMAKILLKSLAKDRGQRYQTVKEMLDGLTKLQEQLTATGAAVQFEAH